MEANPSRSRSWEDFSFFVRSAESMMPARTRENKFIATMKPLEEPLGQESASADALALHLQGRNFSALLHEIINPVFAVKTALRVLQSKQAELAPESLARFLGSSIEELGKVEDLLRNLKASTLTGHLVLQDVSLSSLLDHLAALVHEAFLREGVTLAIALDSAVRVCRADPRALHQVLVNVLNNAFDACRGRPAPKISVQASRREDGRILIRVSDNGCGMSEEQLGKLFQPFQTTKQSGTGLGLSIGRELLARMSGTIAIESALRRGTVVDITLLETAIERT